MGASWQRGILALSLATQVGAQGSPSLSMAGTQHVDASAASAPVSISSRAVDEEEIRQEVIRRLEARIRARREQLAATETRARVDSAQEALDPEAGDQLGALQAAVRRANTLPSARPRPEGDFPPEEDGEIPVGRSLGTAGYPEAGAARLERVYPVGSEPARPAGLAPARPVDTAQAYVSPDEVRNNLGWGPPEALQGQEQGILPPEVTGEPTPPRGPLAVAAPAVPVPARAALSAAPVEPAGPREHTLAPGETLWALSRRFGVSVQDLIRYNAVSNVDDLSVGTVLRIPRPGEAVTGPVQVGTVPQAPRAPAPPPQDAPPAAVTGAYQVLRGDTLYKIARSHHVTVDELLRANPNISASHLAPGMTLTVPGPGAPGARAAAPVPTYSPAPAVPQTAPDLGPRSRPVASSKGDNPYLEWPVSGTVTANFGWKDGKPHTGIDIAAGLGTVVRAAATGKVIFSGEMRGYGKVVILDHLNGFFTVYGHNHENLVQKGSPASPRTVQRGEAVAKVGATGDAVAPQLHFEVRKLNQAVDPFRYLANRAGERAFRPTP